jgi:hypothetical protein
MDPKAFRFVDNLPPGATVICWDGRLLLILPMDWTPPSGMADRQAPPGTQRVRHEGAVA